MRRFSILAVLLTVIVGGLLAFSHAPNVGAQDAEMAGHPLVGTWLINTNADDPTNPPTLASFSADGIFTQVEAEGSVGIGTWQATGPDTAEMTFLGLGSEEGNYTGMATIRAELDVAADGQSLTGSYTIEYTTPDGMGTGHYGPANVSGTKVVVKPMGTPVGPLEALFEVERTPEAGPEASSEA